MTQQLDPEAMTQWKCLLCGLVGIGKYKDTARDSYMHQIISHPNPAPAHEGMPEQAAR